MATILTSATSLDKADVISRLKSNDLNHVVGAVEALRHVAAASSACSNGRPTNTTDDLLEAAMICMTKYLENEDIAVAMCNTLASIAAINKGMVNHEVC